MLRRVLSTATSISHQNDVDRGFDVPNERKRRDKIEMNSFEDFADEKANMVQQKSSGQLLKSEERKNLSSNLNTQPTFGKGQSLPLTESTRSIFDEDTRFAYRDGLMMFESGSATKIEYDGASEKDQGAKLISCCQQRKHFLQKHSQMSPTAEKYAVADNGNFAKQKSTKSKLHNCQIYERLVHPQSDDYSRCCLEQKILTLKSNSGQTPVIMKSSFGDEILTGKYSGDDKHEHLFLNKFNELFLSARELI